MFCAICSKSSALTTLSNVGFSSSLSSGVVDGGGLTHSSVMVLLSTVPFSFEGSRFVERTDGAWIELYDVDASRPACFQMTTNDQWKSSICRTACHSLSPPPGWSGANSPISHTFPSTTIQQSSMELCLEISSTEMRDFPLMLGRGMRWNQEIVLLYRRNNTPTDMFSSLAMLGQLNLTP